MHRLRTLGELRLEGPSGEELTGRRKELVLLAYLAARAPRAAGRGELVELLWGERDETRARHSLRQALLELKRVLGPAVETTRSEVRVLPGLETDAAALTALVAAGRYADAVQVYRGEFLSGCDSLGTETYRLWVDGERASIRRQIVWSLDKLVADAERQEAWDECARWSEAWTDLSPLDEPPHTHLITALHRAGRTGEALARHDALLARLKQEGIEPSRSLQRLCDEIERSGRAASKTSPVAGSAALFRPVLVGRDVALRELRTAWQEVRDSVPAVVIVEAEAGMGRTRVCEEFLRTASADDAAFVLRCRAGNGTLHDGEHSAARDLLDTLRSAPGLAGAPDRALADLSTIAPALRERFPSLPPPRNGSETLVSALAQILQDIAAEVPVVLFVDDIASADTSSQTLIASLAQRLPQADILLLVTACVDARPLPAALQDLYTAPRVRRLRLYPLTDDEVNALVSSMLACEPETQRALVHHLMGESGGNPSLCVSLIETLVDSRRLEPDAEGYWRYDEPESLPIDAAPEETQARAGAAASPARSPARKRWAFAGVVIVAVFAVVMFVWPREPVAMPAAPTLAVGLVRDFTGRDTSLTSALPEMLATNLARLPAVQVISRARMYEILGQLGEGESTARFADAARRAGATELIEGELYRQPDGALRLDIRHVGLRDGAVRDAESVRGRDLFSLVDQATSRIAASIGRPPASGRLADVTTTSPLAYHLYERGLRANYLGDMAGARQLFRAALAEDSSFAMAAFYTLRSEERLALPPDSALQVRLRHLADRAPDRERLLIRAYWSSLNSDPSILAVAETLVARYPSEPDGHLLLGSALFQAGEFTSALTHLRRVIEMDSLSFHNSASHCRACDASTGILWSLVLLDSFPAAERVALDRLRRQPDSHVARSDYTHFLEFSGRIGEAAASAAEASSFSPGDPYAYVFPSMLYIRAGRFEEADRRLAQLALSGPANLRREAMWFHSMSLRYQGRLREAYYVGRSLRLIASTPAEDSARDHVATHSEAQALFEMGRTQEAATLWDRLSNWRGRGAFADLPWVVARNRVWYLTHMATALATGGDTARLPALIDTLEATGKLSLLGRDRRLHHYVRGLLLAARGDTAGAAASFHRATYLPVTPVTPFARISLEYGRMLLALGRAEEAVRMLQPALRGSLETGNFYSTHTAIRELLGRAWDAAGRPDSAAFHYRWVLNAWKNADPEFHARRAAIRQRLDRLLASG